MHEMPDVNLNLPVEMENKPDFNPNLPNEMHTTSDLSPALPGERHTSGFNPIYMQLPSAVCVSQGGRK